MQEKYSEIEAVYYTPQDWFSESCLHFMSMLNKIKGQCSLTFKASIKESYSIENYFGIKIFSDVQNIRETMALKFKEIYLFIS